MQDGVRARVETLKDRVKEVIEDLEMLLEDGCDTDDAAFARAQVDGVLVDYDALVAGAAGDKLEVQRAVGLTIEKMKGLATKLP